MPFLRVPLASILVCAVTVLLSAAPTDLKVEVSVFDQAKHPVPGVEVRLQNAQNIVVSAVTDGKDQAECAQLERGRYKITATKEGFEPIKKSDLDLTHAGVIPLELTLAPAMVRRGQRAGPGTRA